MRGRGLDSKSGEREGVGVGGGEGVETRREKGDEYFECKIMEENQIGFPKAKREERDEREQAGRTKEGTSREEDIRERKKKKNRGRKR